jgi:DNA repair exonuclease SbcCD nuclease subunit
MTSLVHIGDFHAAPGPRNADRYRALDQIVTEGLALPRLGAWVWPGDLNHQRMSIEDRNALAERLIRMASAAPVVIVYGNHDLPGDLDVFGRLKAAHPIYVIDRPHTLRLKLATGEFATLFCLPYPTKSGLVSLGIDRPDILPSAAEALEYIFMQAQAELSGLADVTLMIGHVNVAGSLTSVGQPNIGHEIEIGPQHLDRLGRIPKLLNHIHKAQEIAGAHYAGSVCRLNWGEIEDKSYLVVTAGIGDELRQGATDADGWHYDIERRPIAVPPMYHVEGTLTREGFCLAEAHANTDVELRWHKGDWAGCEVRVRYTFARSERAVLDHESVKAQFPGALRLQVEPMPTLDRGLRAPEVVAARTLSEKVAAYCATTGQAAPDSLLDKLARLEHSDPLVLLSAIQNELQQIEAGDREEVPA